MHEIGGKERRIRRDRHNVLDAGPVGLDPFECGMDAGKRPGLAEEGRQPLVDAELAIELVKPWRAEPDVYPLPELISLLVDEPTQLMALAGRVAHTSGRSADEVRQELDQFIADFETLIERAGFQKVEYRNLTGGIEGVEKLSDREIAAVAEFIQGLR